MQNELNIVGIQANLTWENPEKNRLFFEKEINKLSKNTDIVVLPELFSTGFTMFPERVAEKMDGITVLWMQKIANKNNIALVGSLVISENNNYYNRLLFVYPSKKIVTYNKRHSFTLAGEDLVYTSGEQKCIIDFKGWKICPLICYDLRFPVWSRNKENYDVLIYVANWPSVRIQAWNTLLKARAIENISYVIGVNRVGTDANKHSYSGNSMAIDFLGDDLASLQENEAGIIQTTLLKTALQDTRKKLGFLNDMDDFKINI